MVSLSLSDASLRPSCTSRIANACSLSRDSRSALTASSTCDSTAETLDETDVLLASRSDREAEFLEELTGWSGSSRLFTRRPVSF